MSSVIIFLQAFSVKSAWDKPEVREKIIAGMKKKNQDPEMRKNRSNAVKELWRKRKAGLAPLPMNMKLAQRNAKALLKKEGP